MAAALAPQNFPHAGGSILYTTTGSGVPLTQAGNTTPCGPGLALLVKNGSGGGITVNMAVPAGITVDAMPVVTPFPVNVAAGADAIIPLVPARYQDPVSGLATFGFAATPTSVSVAFISTN
jgi:hypothetical protein